MYLMRGALLHPELVREKSVGESGERGKRRTGPLILPLTLAPCFHLVGGAQNLGR